MKRSVQKTWGCFDPVYVGCENKKQLVLARQIVDSASDSDISPEILTSKIGTTRCEIQQIQQLNVVTVAAHEQEKPSAGRGTSTVYEKIDLDHGAIAINGDTNECACPPSECVCPEPGIGSTYNTIISRSALALNGTIGRPNGALYKHINVAETNDKMEQPPVAMFNGGHMTLASAEKTLLLLAKLQGDKNKVKEERTGEKAEICS